MAEPVGRTVRRRPPRTACPPRRSTPSPAPPTTSPPRSTAAPECSRPTSRSATTTRTTRCSTGCGACIEDAGVPVVIHCGSGPAPGRLHRTRADPGAACAATRDCRSSIAHMGMPEYADFLDICERYDNGPARTPPWRSPRSSRRRCRSPAIAAPRYVTLGDRILFGSDFPNIPYGYADAMTRCHRRSTASTTTGCAESSTATRRDCSVCSAVSQLAWDFVGSHVEAAPIDPPIPVPDVPGGDAGARGLPDRSELTRTQRAIVDASVVADLGLRTGLATLVGTAMLPPVLASLIGGNDLRRERENLEFYAGLAAQHDAAQSFVPPTSPPRVSIKPANPVAQWVAHGDVQHVQFQSSFEAVNPEMRNLWRGLNRNNVVHAQHWRHDDGRTRRCASSTASSARPTCSTGCSSRCRGSIAPAMTFCCTRCLFTVAEQNASRHSAGTASSPTGWPV